jgi:hypothetical protein
MMASNNLSVEQKARYMDDVRLWLLSIRLGWRWVDGELLFMREWQMEEEAMGMSGLDKTKQVMCMMMNNVMGSLTLTMETVDDFGGSLPTLDLRLWVTRLNITLYMFFEKPMASSLVIQRCSAMPENMRMATLNQEMVRRMVNTSEMVEMDTRIQIIDEYCQKLCDSGYEREQMRRAVVGGLTRYERGLSLSLDKDSPS